MNLSGNPLDFVYAFVGGILISFTPCVFPLVPVSAAYIGATGASSRRKGFLLSFVYVSGIAITYAALGVIASLTGQIFGIISSHPATYAVVGFVIMFFGLAMFDIIPLPVQSGIKLPSFLKGNYFSTFFIGMVSGLIIGPCTAPALGAILVYLAAKKNIVYGASLLCAFAYGMGVILILAGTGSSFFAGLPKSGKWLIFVKRCAAVVLVTMGVYFLYTAIRRM
ncbi:MAG TPA: cytochrome c biogenesis protein CcdA [Candidatus Omnitrophota bacterium]|nr:cytochrome c biogenesis protein CcdA [Candidatus Omnitrophota bacterium]HPT07233.1 cytochrome c biogenesis protein CcdA [Candidatus Omnitrophota bacterium]